MSVWDEFWNSDFKVPNEGYAVQSLVASKKK